MVARLQNPFRRIVGVGWGVDEPPTEYGDILIHASTQDLPSFIGSVAKQESGFRESGFYLDDFGIPLGTLGSVTTSNWWDENRGPIIRASILWESFEGDPNMGNATFSMTYRTLEPEEGEPAEPENLPGIGFQIMGANPFDYSLHIYGDTGMTNSFYVLAPSPIDGCMVLQISLPSSPIDRSDSTISGTMRLRFINELP